MKQNILRSLAGLLIVLLFSCQNPDSKKESSATLTDTSTTNTAKKAPPTLGCTLLTGPTKEDSLNFGDPTNDANVYSYADYELRDNEGHFGAHYHCDDINGVLDPVNKSVRVADLCTLLHDITNDPNYQPQNHDLSGLRIHLGMENKNLVLIYETVILKPKAGTDYTSLPSGIFYTADKSGALSRLTTDTSTLIRAYRSATSRIYIVHTDPASETKFIDADTDFSVGDVKYCTMPMQQIFRMYRDNKGDCSHPGNDVLLFNIVASDYFENSGNNFKTHIVVSYNIGQIPELKNTYNGLGADFSQMSPPKNSYITLPSTANSINVLKKRQAVRSEKKYK